MNILGRLVCVQILQKRLECEIVLLSEIGCEIISWKIFNNNYIAKTHMCYNSYNFIDKNWM